MAQNQPALSKDQLAALDLLIAHMQAQGATELGSFIDGLVHSITNAVTSVAHHVTKAATDFSHGNITHGLTQVAKTAPAALTTVTQVAEAGTGAMAQGDLEALAASIGESDAVMKGLSLDDLIRLRAQYPNRG